jgi:hypothetical protein
MVRSRSWFAQRVAGSPHGPSPNVGGRDGTEPESSLQAGNERSSDRPPRPADLETMPERTSMVRSCLDGEPEWYCGAHRTGTTGRGGTTARPADRQHHHPRIFRLADAGLHPVLQRVRVPHAPAQFRSGVRNAGSAMLPTAMTQARELLQPDLISGYTHVFRGVSRLSRRPLRDLLDGPVAFRGGPEAWGTFRAR